MFGTSRVYINRVILAKEYNDLQLKEINHELLIQKLARGWLGRWKDERFIISLLIK